MLLLLSGLVFTQACASDELDANTMQDDNSTIREVTDLGQTTQDMGGAGDMTSGGQDMVDTPDAGGNDQGLLPGDMSTPEDMSAIDQGSPQDMTDMDVQDMSTTPDMMPPEDMSMDMPPQGVCASALVVNQTFEVHPTGFAGQYYSRSVFDGEGVWVVFAMREAADSGTADIWATRIGCDGRPLVAPFEIGETMTGISEVAPAIAALDGNIYVTWIKDTSSDDRIMMRSFDNNGALRQAAPIDVTPELAGVPISGLFVELDIAALPQGEAVLTASHYSPDSGSFQVTVQRVDFSGVLIGDPMEPLQEKGVDQTRPSITAIEGGTFYVSWSRYKPADMIAGTPEEPYRVVYTRFSAGATEPDQGGPFPAQPGAMDDNQLGRYSKELTSNNKVFLTFQSDSTGSNDILVKDGTSGASVTTGFVGNSGFDLRPSIAARTDGNSGAVAWYRASPSPTQNEVHIQRFDVMSNGTFTFGPDTTIQTPEKARAPYGPSITHVSDNVYFISWQDGATTGTAKVQGRFVQL